jgi:hypothetical protein
MWCYPLKIARKNNALKKRAKHNSFADTNPCRDMIYNNSFVIDRFAAGREFTGAMPASQKSSNSSNVCSDSVYLAPESMVLFALLTVPCCIAVRVNLR